MGLQLWKICRQSSWETIIGNIKISAKESLGYHDLKKHKLWFSEGYSESLDQRKQPNCSVYRAQVSKWG
jgi:hypothetical protein